MRTNLLEIVSYDFTFFPWLAGLLLTPDSAPLKVTNVLTFLRHGGLHIEALVTGKVGTGPDTQYQLVARNDEAGNLTDGLLYHKEQKQPFLVSVTA